MNFEQIQKYGQIIKDYTYKNIEELQENYKRRDTSQLAMINENYYQLGLKRIEREILDGVKQYKDVVSFLDIKCERA